MRIEQRQWTSKQGWTPREITLGNQAQLVFIFGATAALKNGELFRSIKDAYPDERTTVKIASLRLSDSKDSFDAGTRAAERSFSSSAWMKRSKASARSSARTRR